MKELKPKKGYFIVKRHGEEPYYLKKPVALAVRVRSLAIMSLAIFSLGSTALLLVKGGAATPSAHAEIINGGVIEKPVKIKTLEPEAFYGYQKLSNKELAAKIDNLEVLQ